MRSRTRPCAPMIEKPPVYTIPEVESTVRDNESYSRTVPTHRILKPVEVSVKDEIEADNRLFYSRTVCTHKVRRPKVVPQLEIEGAVYSRTVFPYVRVHGHSCIPVKENSSSSTTTIIREGLTREEVLTLLQQNEYLDRTTADGLYQPLPEDQALSEAEVLAALSNIFD